MLLPFINNEIADEDSRSHPLSIHVHATCYWCFHFGGSPYFSYFKNDVFFLMDSAIRFPLGEDQTIFS